MALKPRSKRDRDTSIDGAIPPETIADIGRAIYGPIWQGALAKALKVQEQTVRRWTNDGAPAEIAVPMRLLLAEREADVQRVLGVIDALIPAED